MRANVLHFVCLPVGTVKPSQPTAPTTSSKVQFSEFFIFVASVSIGLQINAWVIEIHKIHDGFVVRFFYCSQPIIFRIVINTQVFRQSLMKLLILKYLMRLQQTKHAVAKQSI
jgi:hypothetical protein